MSETKNNKNSSDNFPYYLVVIWIPIFMLVVITTGSNDPNSLLTDEQKIEKQKEIKIKKEQEEKKWEEDKNNFRDGINWILDEKPFPFVHIAGVLIFAVAIRGYSNRHRYDYGMWGLMTPSFILPLSVGFIYLGWLSGYFKFGV